MTTFVCYFSSYSHMYFEVSLTWKINGTNFIIFSPAYLRCDWNNSTTIIGHSVNTLKLNMPFGRTFCGVSEDSAAGDIGRGDVAIIRLGPGY